MVVGDPKHLLWLFFKIQTSVHVFIQYICSVQICTKVYIYICLAYDEQQQYYNATAVTVTNVKAVKRLKTQACFST